jgi:hypothetical protein
MTWMGAEQTQTASAGRKGTDCFSAIGTPEQTFAFKLLSRSNEAARVGYIQSRFHNEIAQHVHHAVRILGVRPMAAGVEHHETKQIGVDAVRKHAGQDRWAPRIFPTTTQNTGAIGCPRPGKAQNIRR